ncbi:hypothetical protein, partial [Vibrio genomosp. F10]|uniref:hypothetical protein n=1 Tax=Vibrio genomosp. F10 TaxID=723171 RepID=UPI0018EA3128
DGSQVSRSATNIVFEAIDLFVGGDDTLLAGSGLDRMQGHFGSDLFFASFSEDILIGEYGRFTFIESDDESISDATFIISLAQGKLDLIRQMQTGLFGGYAKQVYAQSNLGQAARSRTAVTTVFSLDAGQAFGNLNPIFQNTSSGGGEGADFVIPTDPTAAGFEDTLETITNEDDVEPENSEAVEATQEGAQETDGATLDAKPEPQIDPEIKDGELETQQCAEDDAECVPDSSAALEEQPMDLNTESQVSESVV